MLTSLFYNNSNEEFHIYLMHSCIKEEEIEDLNNFVIWHAQKLYPIQVSDKDFADAPIVMHYTREMYYRLLAYKYLPPSLDKILYLDPDILVINRIRQLYETDLSGYLYAAAYHNRIPVKEINKVRLLEYEIEEYFNSGVLLMNLKLQQEQIKEDEIYAFVTKYKNRLILPDQDILNSLYSKNIWKLDELIYNYDTRYYKYNKLLSKGQINMDYIFDNTVILHFCGKKKPWHKNYSGEFHSLYKHYEKMTFGT